MTMPDLTPGSQLVNGSTIVAVKHPRSGGKLKIVLAITPDGEYATWKIDPENGKTLWGEYPVDFDEAVASLDERSA
jgi:hypothetical protein